MAPIPPTDLRLPADVTADVVDRGTGILDHGPAAANLALPWWNRTLTDAGLGRFVVTADPNGTAEVQLTRGSLFKLADTVGPDADDDAYLNLLWHVLAWGSGPRIRNNRRRIAAFIDPADARTNVALLRQSVEHARSGNTADSYRALVRPGRASIPYLGPSFFTKYLYFAGNGAASHPCVILDARVATRLHHAGWRSLPPRRMNWYTDTYVAYCELLARWADELSTPATPVASDQIERALFGNSA
ncbi:hypothetical protein APR04_002985 [Promicromonospora umidemergens]|uniref:Uncharacterized protein n=1 Tax=Promicromonospora umidemergens TaxID=629679 RepID=A0ABP8WFU2_9MICO|nr:hypothetical protein [Promicromonospora umidemergens]MCP2284065.1 hypothetical protein [Promicromonospora umidemergens]